MLARDSSALKLTGRKERTVYLTTHSSYFIYSYVAPDEAYTSTPYK